MLKKMEKLTNVRSNLCTMEYYIINVRMREALATITTAVNGGAIGTRRVLTVPPMAGVMKNVSS